VGKGKTSLDINMIGDTTYFLTSILLLACSIMFYAGAVNNIGGAAWYFLIGIMTGLAIVTPSYLAEREIAQRKKAGKQA
jgi:hypothetical protein